MAENEIVQAEKRAPATLFNVIVDDAKRLREITGILSKFGYGNLVNAVKNGLSGDYQTSSEILNSLKDNQHDTASKLREMIEALGTTYIKFGQMLSTRYDLLPEHIIKELAKLQDGSPALPFPKIEEILNDAYGDYHRHFASVEEKPLGAASIGQVHRAVLTDGTHVVVKVQRPGLLPLVRSDIDIIKVLAKSLDYGIEEIAYFNLPSLIDEFERSIVSELDFTHERQNIEYFMERYGKDEMFVFPEPNVELTRRNILVMREIEGKKITQIEPDTEIAHKMADSILNLAFSMVLKDGVFHADPHPGNVFVTPDNKIGLLDFGLVGNFTQQQRQEFLRIMVAVYFGDCSLIASSLLNLGHPTKRVVFKDLETDISIILHQYLKTSLNKIDVVGFVNDFISTGQKYGIQIPSEFMNAVRALVNIEGILVYLDPNSDLISKLGDMGKSLIMSSFSKENIPVHLFRLLLEAEGVGRILPTQFIQLMQDANTNGIAIRLGDQTINPIKDSIHSFATRICISLTLVGLTLSLCLGGYDVLFRTFLVLDFIWILSLVIWHFKGRSVRKRFSINPLLENIHRITHRY